jgi:hypothetical protein
MLRKSDLLWLTVAAIAGVELFHTSYRVQNLREEIATLDREIIAEQSGIQVTKAEWGVYTDPVRLEALAGSYLTTLTPITAAQVASFNALPLKPGTPPGGMALVASNPDRPMGSPASGRAVGVMATPASASGPVASASVAVPAPGTVHPAAVALASVGSSGMGMPAAPVPIHHRMNRQAQADGGQAAVLTRASVARVSSASRPPPDDEIGNLLLRLGRGQ